MGSADLPESAICLQHPGRTALSRPRDGTDRAHPPIARGFVRRTDLMNALLVQPTFPDTFWSFRHALKFIGKRAAFPPLGLLTVASLLPRDWELRLVDLNVQPLREADLEWADCALISGMAVQRISAPEVIARCKEAGITVIAGGPQASSQPESIRGVDHYVLNEAEVTLEAFLSDLRAGKALPMYRSSEFADLTESPAPMWELANLKRYAMAGIQYSRGCPFDCDFCNVTALFGHRPRVKSGEQIIAEMEALQRIGWRGQIFFVDDNLIANRKQLRRDLLPALINWRRHNRRFTFQTQVSIDLADDDALVGMLVEAGFRTVFIGIETPDDNCLAECNKRQNLKRDLIADVRKLHRAGLQVQGGFILGFDGDTASTFQRQIDFIQRSGIVTAMVGLLQAVPGTKLHQRLTKEGRLIGELTGDNVDGTTNILTRMDPEKLREGYRKIMEHLYAPEEYYKRVKTFLRDYRGVHGNGLPAMGNLKALVRSAVPLGLLGKERLQYWKLILWTSIHRPRLLPNAMSMLILGHHFRRICETHIF